MKKIICSLVLLSFLFFSGCDSYIRGKKHLEVTNGELDLTHWNIETDSFITLSGEYKFIWQQDDETFKLPGFDDSDWDYFEVPNSWDNVSLKNNRIWQSPAIPGIRKKLDPRGFCWLRVSIKNLNNRKLGLFLGRDVPCYELYVNGFKLMNNGVPGNSREDSFSSVIPQLIRLPLIEDKMEISWKIANYDISSGGPVEAPILGDYHKLYLNKWLHDTALFFLMGLVTLSGLYHLFLWLNLYRKKECVYYSACCFLITLFLLNYNCFINIVLMMRIPNSLFVQVNYICLIFIFGTLVLFYYQLFTRDFSGKIKNIIVAVCTIFAILVLTTPIIWTNLNLVIHISGVFISLWILGSIIKAFYHKRPESALAFTGILIFSITIFIWVFTTSDDILFGKNYFDEIALIPFGILFYVLSQSLIIARRFNHAYKTASELSQNLQDQVKKKTEEITRQNIQLQKLYSEKTAFFINLAHETKIPLTLILNFLNKYIKKHQVDRDLAIIRENLNKLLYDMVNFLDSEKLRKGKIIYNHDTIVHLSDLIRKKTVLFKELAGQKKIELRSKINGKIHIRADRTAIERVVNNILDNAVKYSSPGGSVDIHLEEKELGEIGRKIVLFIRDSGRGIPEEKISRIFEPYYQIIHKKSNNEGMGMGLYITKQIMESMGGEIEVKSTLGKGTEIRLIFSPAEPVSGEEISLSDSFLIPTPQKPLPVQPPGDAWRGNEFESILVIEDNTILLKYLADIFKRDYNVYVAENGKIGLEKMKINPKPSLIISDIMMDEMDGYTFYEEMMKQDQFTEIPVIFLTARTSHTERLRGLAMGGIDYIHKPFLAEELEYKVKAVLQNRHRTIEKNIQEMERKIASLFRQKTSLDQSKINFITICDQYGITNREKEIIRAILTGKKNEEIGLILNISSYTVRNHITSIYSKCGINNRVELVNVFV